MLPGTDVACTYEYRSRPTDRVLWGGGGGAPPPGGPRPLGRGEPPTGRATRPERQGGPPRPGEGYPGSQDPYAEGREEGGQRDRGKGKKDEVPPLAGGLQATRYGIRQGGRADGSLLTRSSKQKARRRTRGAGANHQYVQRRLCLRPVRRLAEEALGRHTRRRAFGAVQGPRAKKKKQQPKGLGWVRPWCKSGSQGQH